MDRKLLDILCCPSTRQSLAMLDSQGLDVLNRAIAAGGITAVVLNLILPRDKQDKAVFLAE